jgi:hypothetical protein
MPDLRTGNLCHQALFVNHAPGVVARVCPKREYLTDCDLVF